MASNSLRRLLLFNGLFHPGIIPNPVVVAVFAPWNYNYIFALICWNVVCLRANRVVHDYHILRAVELDLSLLIMIMSHLVERYHCDLYGNNILIRDDGFLLGNHLFFLR